MNEEVVFSKIIDIEDKKNAMKHMSDNEIAQYLGDKKGGNFDNK